MDDSKPGGPDPTQTSLDLDSDGTADAIVGDSTGDGTMDYVVVHNPDGSIVAGVDTDNSGTLETVMVDTHGDGEFDVVGIDVDDDGIIDYVEAAAPASAPTSDQQVPWSPEQPGMQPAPTSDQQVPWSPEQPGMQPAPTNEPIVAPAPEEDLVWGRDESEYGQTQTLNGYCGPVSVAMIVSEMTGAFHGETELVQAAANQGLLVYESGVLTGMYTTGVEQLLESYGIEAHREVGSVDTLRQHLDAEKNIILFVDSSEVWYAPDAGENAYGGQDHFLVITEIDDARGIVTLNDPGIPNGVGLEVDIAVLEAAWADSGNEMVVTDGVSGVLGAQAGTAPPSHPGFVVLPVSLSANDLRLRSIN